MNTKSKITPREIVWWCHGYKVRLDEDGVALIAPNPARHLEEPELRQLLEVVAAAFGTKETGSAPIPAPDGIGWDQRSRENQAARLVQVAQAAIRTELIGPDQVPF